MPRSTRVALVPREGALTSVATFEGLYDAWFDRVVHWIGALGGPDAEREDLAQEVFLLARRRFVELVTDEVEPWLFRLTRQKVRDFRRRVWFAHMFGRAPRSDPDDLPYDGVSPSSALERKERRRRVYEMLATMSDKRRVVFVLYEIEGYQGDEIARLLGIPLKTVWTRLFHARKDFRRLMVQHGE